MIDGRTKVDRLKVVEMRIQHPDWSLEIMGEKLGITRERVRQILKAHNIPTRRYLTLKQRGLECPRCLGEKKKVQEICTPCYRIEKPNYYTLTCIVCSKEFQRKGSTHRRAMEYYPGKGEIVFCGRKCFGHYAGTNFGWPVHKKGRYAKKQAVEEAATMSLIGRVTQGISKFVRVGLPVGSI